MSWRQLTNFEAQSKYETDLIFTAMLSKSQKKENGHLSQFCSRLIYLPQPTLQFSRNLNPRVKNSGKIARGPETEAHKRYINFYTKTKFFRKKKNLRSENNIFLIPSTKFNLGITDLLGFAFHLKDLFSTII